MKSWKKNDFLKCKSSLHMLDMNLSEQEKSFFLSFDLSSFICFKLSCLFYLEEDMSSLCQGFSCPDAKPRRWAVMRFCMQFENPLESTKQE